MAVSAPLMYYFRSRRLIFESVSNYKSEKESRLAVFFFRFLILLLGFANFQFLPLYNSFSLSG